VLRAPVRRTLTALALLLVPPLGTYVAQPFGEELSITEVEIPVQVLSHGAPVRGLTRDDFEVFDDGERRPIIAFRTIDLGQASRAPGRGTTGSGAATPNGVEPRISEGRRILLLFDFLFARDADLKRAVRGARKLVSEQLHPADRVGVAYLAGGGASVLLGFTADRSELEHALGAIEAILDRQSGAAKRHLDALAASRRGQGQSEGQSQGESDPSLPAASLGDLSSRVGPAAAVALAGGGVSSPDLALIESARRDAELAGSLDSLARPTPFSADLPDATLGRLFPNDPLAITASLATAIEGSAIRTMTLEIGRLITLLRGVTGQKHVLFLSQGFSSEVLNQFDSPQRALALRNLETLFEAFRRNGWTLDAIDVSGLEAPTGEDQSWVAGGRPGRNRGGSRSGFDAGALFYMANETGGQLFENYNRIADATAELIQRTSVTYVLTIDPGTLSADGHYHPLEVRLRTDRPPATDIRLLHRPGYYAPKPGSDKSLLEARLDSIDMLLGDREIDPLGVRVLAAAAAADPKSGEVIVPFAVDVPGEAIVAGRSASTVNLDLQVYAVDSHGGVQDLWHRRVRFDLAKLGPRLREGGARLRGRLSLPPDDYRLRVLVTPQGGKGSALKTVPVAARSPAGSLPGELESRAPAPWLDLS